MSQKVEINGEEVEVFTTAEVAEREAAARAAVEGEWKPKYETAEQEKARITGILEQRTKEFGQARSEFKRMSDEQYAKLDEKDKIIYDNQLALSAERESHAEADKKAYEAAVTAAIRSKVGGDQKLFEEVTKMYELINIDDVTPEGIAMRVAAAFGALGQTAPDLLAASGFSGGSFEPPRKATGSESFADSERGRAMAEHFGLMVEPPKKQ